MSEPHEDDYDCMKYRCPRCGDTFQRSPGLVNLFRAFCEKTGYYVKLLPVKTKPRQRKRPK